MATNLFPTPVMQFFDANGNPLAGGKLFTYAAGTTTPQATYTNYGGGTANTNPVILDSAGRAAIWLNNNRYYMVLKDANDVQIWTADDVNGPNGPTLAALAAGNGATLIGYTPTDTGVATTVNTRLQQLDGVSATATATDREYKAAVNAYRNATAVSGGTPGFVNFNIYAKTDTGATETAFEWGITSVMNNYSAAGQNVALYGQGNKRSTGPTWGVVSEVRDFTQTANPTAGLVSVEAGIFANGTDNNNNRVGVDVSVGKGVAGGTINTTAIGLRIAPTNLDPTEGQLKDGINLGGNITTGVSINSSGTWGIRLAGAYTVGVDLSAGTHSLAAIRIKAGENISFDATASYQLLYNAPVGGVAGLRYIAAGVERAIISNSGGIVLGETVTWTSTYTSTFATAGTNGAVPAQVAGYITVYVGPNNYKIPYFNP